MIDASECTAMHWVSMEMGRRVIAQNHPNVKPCSKSREMNDSVLISHLQWIVISRYILPALCASSIDAQTIPEKWSKDRSVKNCKTCASKVWLTRKHLQCILVQSAKLNLTSWLLEMTSSRFPLEEGGNQSMLCNTQENDLHLWTVAAQISSADEGIPLLTYCVSAKVNTRLWIPSNPVSENGSYFFPTVICRLYLFPAPTKSLRCPDMQ